MAADDGRIIFSPHLKVQGIPLSVGSAHHNNIHAAWPLAYLRSLRKLCSSEKEMQLALAAVLDRFRRFLPSAEYMAELERHAGQIVVGDSSRRPARVQTPVGTTKWLVLDYHPMWDSSFLGRALHSVNSNPDWQAVLKYECGGHFAQVRVAWRMRLPRFVPYVHKLLSRETLSIWK